MENSILNEVKKLLGIDESYKVFDTDIIIHINTYLGVLNELGVGVTGFTIEDDTATWGEFLANATVPLNEVKSYLYLRVRQVFDPPASSVMSSAIDKQIDELGWRMTTKVECTVEEG